MLTLQKSVPLIIATLAIIVAFKSNIWNIGTEGQIALGVVATTGIGLFFHAPGFLRIFFALILSFLAGAFWVSIAAVLKIKWNVPEIPITLMGFVE